MGRRPFDEPPWSPEPRPDPGWDPNSHNLADTPLQRATREFWLDRDADEELIAPHVRPEDNDAALVMQRRQDLEERAPNVHGAFFIVNLGGQAVPLHPATLGVKGRPLATVEGVEEYWSAPAHLADAAGLLLTPGLAAIVAASWSAWVSWIHTYDEEVLMPMAQGSDRYERRLEPRGFGGPARLEWWPATDRKIWARGASFRGGVDGEDYRRVDRALRSPRRDAGGLLVWALPQDPAGGFPTFEGRRLAPELVLASTGEVVPWSARVGAMKLQHVGGHCFAAPDGSSLMPPWLVRELRRPVVERAVRRVRRTARAVKEIATAPRSDILDSVR